ESPNVSYIFPAGNSEGIKINFGNPPGGNISFTISYSNTCGSSSEPLYFHNSGTTEALALSPNPARSSVTVTTQDEEIPADAPLTKSYLTAGAQPAGGLGGISTITVYDLSGKLIKAYAFGKNQQLKSTQIDVSGLPSGTYLVEVSDGRRRST